MTALYILYVWNAVPGTAKQDEMRSGRWSGLELLRKSYEMFLRLTNHAQRQHFVRATVTRSPRSQKS
jgi:hypothetical protein